MTPEIDALAEGGFRFPRAVSPAPVTQPSHASLFTGWLPRRHGVRDNGQVLGPSPPTLAERLRERGYHTAAFISGFPLVADFGLDRGFDHYDDELQSGASSAGNLERPAGDTTAAAAAWLKTAAEPWFVWVHYFDPHDPYRPPAGFERPGPRGAYLGEVAYTDHALGELRRAAGAGGPVLTVFAADHGESLGEHGEETHGFFIYDSTVAIPLIFHLPGRVPAGESGRAARLVDVAPTVLDLLGLPPLETHDRFDGVSLKALFTGGDEQVPPAYVETRRPWISYGWAPLRALVDDGWKLIAAPRPELYDLRTDPGETTDQVRDERARARRLRDLLLAAEETVAASTTSADPEAMARLRALGYVGAGSTAGEPPAAAADPKDRVELWNVLSGALALAERGRHRDAVAAFDAVLEKDPGNPFALSRSGAALLAAGDAAGAAERLGRAARVRPDDADTRHSYALALTRAGQLADAARQWFEVARLQPRRVDAWVNLAVTLGRSGRGEEAIGALGRAVELAPERVDLRAQLAIAHNTAGRPRQALEQMLAAAGVTGPASFPYPSMLGLLLLGQGRAEEARAWLERSHPGEGDFAAARFELARLEVAAGRLDAARTALRAALQADPRLAARARSDRDLATLLD